MVYALKLLAAVLVVIGAAYYVFRPAFAELFTPTDYRRIWRLVAIGSVAAYLSVYPAVFLLAIAVIALYGAASTGRGPAGKIGLYLLFACTLPPISQTLGGFGGINYILNLDSRRVTAIVLLGWAALEIMGSKAPQRSIRFLWIDLLVLAYQGLRFALQVPHSTFTTMIRLLVEATLDILLPYFVITRGLRSVSDLRLAGGHLLAGLAFAAAIGVMETLLQHNLYSGLQSIYDIRWQLTYALMRGNLIRVQAVTPTPIILALMMLFGLATAYWLKGKEWRRGTVFALFGAMLFTLVATFSRGPWLGLAVMGGSLLAMRRMPAAAFRVLLVVVILGAAALRAAGADAQIVAALGAIFGSDQADLSSIEYRRELLDTATALIKQSPWLGVPNYAAQMQNLKQGEGIIDIVNSYVAILLDAGVVGLAVYLLPYLVVFTRLHSAARRHLPGVAPANSRFALGFAALILGCLFAIFTTSTWGVLTLLMVVLLALPLAWLALPEQERDSAVQRADIELELEPADDPLGRQPAWIGGPYA